MSDHLVYGFLSTDVGPREDGQVRNPEPMGFDLGPDPRVAWTRELRRRIEACIREQDGELRSRMMSLGILAG